MVVVVGKLGRTAWVCSDSAADPGCLGSLLGWAVSLFTFREYRTGGGDLAQHPGRDRFQQCGDSWKASTQARRPAMTQTAACLCPVGWCKSGVMVTNQDHGRQTMEIEDDSNPEADA